ncbi:Pyridoxal-phosphate dependent enzyme [Saliniramus fredricksonii]|uniref:Pyridoxal-phosphate dependent enzyme n=2 Tax=Saliniramus fredricksonii TaxID=1653334 RepID=A0ABY0KDL8_9HYPH|nr:Pyridoxal-phosphate dependent enzyme [Saliniramus fredricksonii]
MQDSFANPWRGSGIAVDAPFPLDDAGDVARLLAACPAHAPTPLHEVPALATRAGVAQIFLKDERARMGLGSFKALGAAHAIARAASQNVQDNDWAHALSGWIYVTASAGQSRALGRCRCASVRGAGGDLSRTQRARGLRRTACGEGGAGGARRRDL